MLRAAVGRDTARGRGGPVKRRVGRCVCLEPGVLKSGIRGALAWPPYDNGVRHIERCDACERFPSDEVACKAYARVHGGWCGYDFSLKVVWVPL